jgi:hypothetical protein
LGWLGFYTVNGNEEPNRPAEMGKISDAMRREVQPIVKAVEQIVRDARLAKASCGSALPIVQRVALVVDELLSGGERPVVRQGSSTGYASGVGMVTGVAMVTEVATMTEVATVTVSGGAALGPMTVAGETTVEERRSPIDGQLLVMVILWLIVLVGPEAIMKANLSSGVALTLDSYYAVVGAIAVAVTADYYQKRRKR